jgi:hypothetical protein
MSIPRSDAGSDTPAVLQYTPKQGSNLGRWLVTDDSYKVGFGKPPKHTQFRKGRSGNPNGRPKGSKNFYALIRKILEAKVIVKSPGGTRSMTKLDAALTQLANKALSGDLKALREVLRLAEKVQEQEPYLNAPTFTVNFVKPAEEDGEQP